MAATRARPELVVIVGPTASGKSSLAMRLAQLAACEIIAADSRTIYKSMDIATAKPTKADQTMVPHWGLDLVEPGEYFSVHDFKKYADAKIIDIKDRGKLPILVGGTGLYIDSLLFDFKFRNKGDKPLRDQLEKKTVEELQAMIKAKGYDLPNNFKNRRHLIRTIESEGQVVGRNELPPPKTLIIGLLPDEKTLKDNISVRTKAMFKDGIVTETSELLQKYRPEILQKGGIGYREIANYLNKETTLPESKQLFERAQWQYARRQRTWFKRNSFIEWFDSPDTAYKALKGIL